jgi:hypothetical protein
VQVIPVVPHSSNSPYYTSSNDSGLNQMSASGSIMGPKPGNLHGPKQSGDIDIFCLWNEHPH